MTKDPKRFEIVLNERHGISDQITILRDTETGVCYLRTQSGYAGGLTPLLDAEGRPVVMR